MAFNVVAFSFAIALSVTPCFATYRHIILSQADWDAKVGFYLDVESNADSGTALLSQAHLFFAVADGTNWSYTPFKGLEMGHTYKVTCNIGRAGSSVAVSGVGSEVVSAGFVPAQGKLQADQTPSWAPGPADFKIETQSLEISDGSGVMLKHSFVPGGSVSGLSYFNPSPPVEFNWRPPSGTFTITATFKVMPATATALPDRAIIDQFGQVIDASYPSKVNSVKDLLRSEEKEDAYLAVTPALPGRDRFGGEINGWSTKATGFYWVKKKNGFWWLISPLGHPLFYTGLCTTPALDATPVSGREQLFARLPARMGAESEAWSKNNWGGEPNVDYVSFGKWNLMRRDGRDWNSAQMVRAKKRLAAWGFTGEGKWSIPLNDTPTVPVLFYQTKDQGRHPDIFDPRVQSQIRQSLEAQMTPDLTNPYIVGWSIKNEFDEIITTDEIKQFMLRPSSSPGRTQLIKAAIDQLYHGDVVAMASAWHIDGSSERSIQAGTLSSIPTADIEFLRQTFARAYYAFLYRTVKAIDPNHLYLGFWIVPGWWQNSTDWSLIAPYCDVIGYDRYAPTFADAALSALLKQTQKPVLLGEYSFPPFYNGARGFGQYFVSSRSSEDAGKMMAETLTEAAKNPYCVGALWFEYKDEPITGRGPGSGPKAILGEDYAFGFLDVCDQPKWSLIHEARAINGEVNGIRMKAMGAHS